MERDKAEIYVWQITDLHNNIGDEYGAVDLLNEYANKRVIEELERLKSDCDAEDDAHSFLMSQAHQKRINQLKQE